MKLHFWGAKAVAFGALLLASATPAVAGVIDFETATAGSKPNGFTIGGVTFNDTLGADLQVSNFGNQGVGNGALAVGGDDASILEMLFSTTSIDLSLVFGNDDPGYTSPGDVALLRIFMGATQVGQTFVVLNRDDIANQTIGINGIAFNRATFVYANSAFNPLNLTEVVDNITFTPNVTSGVPEPATWAMMLMGFGAIGGALRRREKVATRVRFA